MQPSFQRIALSLLAALYVPVTSAVAADTDISVSNAYVRMVPNGIPTTGAFMLIKNSGSVDRKLLRVDSPAAKSVELHTHQNDNGVMKMRPVKEIAIGAKSATALKPGSYHIMLIDLKQTLKEDEMVPFTLNFDDGSTKVVDVPVKKPQAMLQMEHDKTHKH